MRQIQSGWGTATTGRPNLRRLRTRDTSDTKAGALGRLGEIPIPGYKYDFLVAELERRGEVDRVVASQPQVFGMGAGADGKLVVDAYRDQLRPDLLEGLKRLSVLLLPEPIEAASSRERRPALGVGKDARRCGVGTAPKLRGQLGAVLDHEDLD